jgi:tetratricopeptide (TPR) repeat protein
MKRALQVIVTIWLGLWAGAAEDFFARGTAAYRAGDYSQSAHAFQKLVDIQPASGTLQNLGNAEWQRGETGAAVLAWERALWLDPFQDAARDNLLYARKVAQLETPQLGWHEVVSSWLPVNWWVWITGGSFWLAVLLGTLPGILRWRRAAWHQGVAALGLMVFLLSVPAHFGVGSRASLGFVLHKETPLRLTPTFEAQSLTRLAAGEPVRAVRARGDYLLIRTSRALGWVDRAEIGFVSPSP